MNVRFLIPMVVVTISTLFMVAPPPQATPTNPAAGREIYERHCLPCHGMDGRGGRLTPALPVQPPNLVDQAYMQGRTDAQLFGVIKEGSAAAGLSSAMPAFGEQLTDQEIWHAVAYVRTLAKPTSVLGSSATAGASTSPPSPSNLHIARLRLSIWPEYDDPRVLVIFRGEFTPADAFPASITIPLPKDAELIGAGMISDQNALLLQPHQIVSGPDHDTLELSLPIPRFFLEYYYNPFSLGSAEKRFVYTIPTLYPIAQLAVDVQQPLEASNFTLDPPAMARGVDSRGFTYHQFSYRDLESTATKTLTIAYQKSTNRPSVTKQQLAPSPVTSSALPVSKAPMLLGLLGIIVVLSVGGVLLWTGYRRRREAPTSAPITPSRRPPSASKAPQHFCSQCGRRLQPEYGFCPGCGCPLERS